MTTIIGTGILYKEVDYEYTPGMPGRPAIPGRTARPGYWDYRTVTNCLYNPGNYEATLEALIALAQKEPGQSFSSSYSSGGYVCVTSEDRYYVPAVSAIEHVPAVRDVPSQLTKQMNIGWNARASSIQPLTGSGNYSFIVPASTTGAVVGLSFAPASSGYADIRFGFHVSHGVVRIYEAGNEVSYIGARPGSTLKVQRTGDSVFYYIDGDVVRTTDAAEGTVFLSAAMYTGGDSITYAGYSDEDAGSLLARMPPFTAAIGDVAMASISGALGAFVGGISGGSGSGLTGALWPPSGYFGKQAAVLTGMLGALTALVSDESDAPAYAAIAGFVMPPQAFLDVKTGEIGSIASTLGSFIGFIAQGRTGTIRGEMAAPRAHIYSLPVGDAPLVSSAVTSDQMTAATELIAFIDSTGTITGLMTIEVLHSALMTSTASIGVTLSTQAQIEVLLQSAARAIHGLLPADTIGEAWVLNTLGMTRYEAYDYNSFAKIGEHYYGAKADGIYLLEGRDDNGTAVTASVNFGNLDFGSLNRKALPYLYAGVASDGNLRLKVVADGSTYYYTVRDNTELLKAHRFELGRGLQASYYDITLISDGAVFDVTDIEFFPLELKRRL